MANTERLQVIRTVREAKASVRNARFESSIPARTRAKLETLYTMLDRLEDDLILCELDEALDALEKASGKIEAINQEIRETKKELEAITEKVEKATKAVKILVDIASRAASVGLI